MRCQARADPGEGAEQSLRSRLLLPWSRPQLLPPAPRQVWTPAPLADLSSTCQTVRRFAVLRVTVWALSSGVPRQLMVALAGWWACAGSSACRALSKLRRSAARGVMPSAVGAGQTPDFQQLRRDAGPLQAIAAGAAAARLAAERSAQEGCAALIFVGELAADRHDMWLQARAVGGRSFALLKFDTSVAYFMELWDSTVAGVLT